jgi:hypothetical protein
MRNARQLGQYGVVINEPALDYQQLLKRVDEVTEVVPVFVEFEVAVPDLRPAWW